jgi:hypothetical protein
MLAIMVTVPAVKAVMLAVQVAMLVGLATRLKSW